MFPVAELLSALFLFALTCFVALALVADKRAQRAAGLLEKKPREQA